MNKVEEGCVREEIRSEGQEEGCAERYALRKVG